MEVTLTPGAIRKFINGEVTSEKEMIPVLQVMDLSPFLVQSKTTQPERFKLSLSDGTHSQKAILVPHLNGYVKGGILQAGSIVRLTHFVCNRIDGVGWLVVIRQLEVISTKSEQQRFSVAMSSESSCATLAPNTQNGPFFSTMGVTLTPGAIGKIINGEVTTKKEMIPVLQVMDLKLVQSKTTQPERFALSLWDGTHSQRALLAAHLNGYVKGGILQAGSLVRLTRFVCISIQHRWVVIVRQLEVIPTKAEQQGFSVAMSSESSGTTLAPNTQDGDCEDLSIMFQALCFERFEDLS